MCVGYLRLFDSHEAVVGRVTSGTLSVSMCIRLARHVKQGSVALYYTV